MQISTVNCAKCGTPVNVGETTNFVTCLLCGARLAVKRTDDSVFTEVAPEGSEVAQEVVKRAEPTAQERNEAIRAKKRERLIQDIEKINGEWEKEAKGWGQRYHNGKDAIPTVAVVQKQLKIWSRITIVLVPIVVFLIWALTLINNFAPVIPYILFLGFAIWRWKSSADDEIYAKAFEDAYTRYKYKYRNLRDEMDKLAKHP